MNTEIKEEFGTAARRYRMLLNQRKQREMQNQLKEKNGDKTKIRRDS